MERRFEVRKAELLAECQVDPMVFRGMRRRLEKFVEPFAECLRRVEQKRHAQTYCAGLLSDLKRKNAESIAYRDDQDRKNLQNFIGNSCWDHKPLLDELACQVGRELGQPDAIIAVDPSAFPKKGTDSVGTERQWCGRLGKVDNCQVAVYLGYVSGVEHALVDTRLYLPKSWAKDRARRKKCRVPKGLCYKKRTQLALEMLDERGPLLPHRWVTGDDELGRASWFRRSLRERSEQYLLAVPVTTTIRDLETPPPEYGGFGGVRKRRFVAVGRWRESLPKDAWTRVEVRDGEKGPLTVDIVTCRVQARDENRNVGPEELLVVIRRSDELGKTIHDYYLSNAPAQTALPEFARAAKAHHRIEECIQRGKSEAGLADYQLRCYPGWYHHQALSLIATWFLLQEARRGKKTHARVDGSAGPRGVGAATARCLRVRQSPVHRPRTHTPTETQSTRALLSLETTETLTSLEYQQATNLEQ